MKNRIKKIIPNFLFGWYHFCLAYLGALAYGFPSRKMTVIGVTGTKGKTTTCNLIVQFLEGAGFKTGMATTVSFRIGKREWDSVYKQTMLGRFKLQKLLKQMIKEGCKYAVIETSSEGILQHRHRGIDYSVAVFTNLSPEHIERHGSFEKYRATKLKLFEAVAKKKNGVGIYNMDDKNAGLFVEPGVKHKIGFGGKGKYQISNIKLSPDKTEFELGGEKFEMPLVGEFNVYNAAAAICVALSVGVELQKIREILKTVKPIPGRLELINEGQFFKIIVDYAHEPSSLEAVYRAVSIFNPKRVIGVLGAQGGGRDRWKRKEMGRISEKYCDSIILTNEDPYDEDPLKIIDDVAEGVKEKECKKISDRREAIRYAFSLAKPGDAVIITGKGTDMFIMGKDGTKIPWDDRAVCREELKKLG